MIPSLTAKIEHREVEDKAISLYFPRGENERNHLVLNFAMLYFRGQRRNHDKTGCFSLYLAELGTMRYSELAQLNSRAYGTRVSAKTQDFTGFLECPITCT